MPAVRIVLERIAVPLSSGSGFPKSKPSTWNWTEPVGVSVSEVAGMTVVVNVSWSPKTLVLVEAAMLVTVATLSVGIGITVSVLLIRTETLSIKSLASPPLGWFPTNNKVWDPAATSMLLVRNETNP